jgi:hypothetical protein
MLSRHLQELVSGEHRQGCRLKAAGCRLQSITIAVDFYLHHRKKYESNIKLSIIFEIIAI